MALLRKGIRSCDMLCSIFSDFFVLSFKNAAVLGLAFLHSFLPSLRFMKGNFNRGRSVLQWLVDKWDAVLHCKHLVSLNMPLTTTRKRSHSIFRDRSPHTLSQNSQVCFVEKTSVYAISYLCYTDFKNIISAQVDFFFHGISAHTKPVPLDYFFVSHSMYQPHHSTLCVLLFQTWSNLLAWWRKDGKPDNTNWELHTKYPSSLRMVSITTVLCGGERVLVSLQLPDWRR